MFDLLRQRLGEIIPLNTLLGIEMVSIGDGVAEARIPFRREVTNHLGTLHATAIFGVAEAASGAAMAGAFAPVVLRIRAIASHASVSFIKVARTDLTAQAATAAPPQLLRERLAADGKVAFDVHVKLRDGAGTEVAEVTVAWKVTQKERGPR